MSEDLFKTIVVFVGSFFLAVVSYRIGLRDGRKSK